MKRQTVRLGVLLAASTAAAVVSFAGSVRPSRRLTPGHWANGAGEGNSPEAAFDLSETGEIANFTMTARVGGLPQACTLGIERLRVQMGRDGKFVISHLRTYEDVAAELGDHVMALGIVPKGQPYEVLRISGTATATAMAGTYTIRVCRGALLLADNDGSWQARLKKH